MMRLKIILPSLAWLLGGILILTVFGVAAARPARFGDANALYLPIILKPEGPTATLTPTATATASPTATATSTATVTATPTVTQPAAPTPPENWLERLNYYRALASLAPVTENVDWSDGDWKHARYCVKNDYIGHDEDPSNAWYTLEGDVAAANGNVMVHSWMDAPDSAAIDLWMSGPFHGVGIIDPQLIQSGYGSYREADGGWQMAAVLDVLRGLGSLPPSVTFPVQWPGDGTTTYLTSYGGTEAPDPLTSCSGYSAPSGLPVILQIGSGGVTPSVTDHTVLRNGLAVEHCVFDETSYTNPNGSYQSLGRNVLGSRDAIVIIPRQPLTPGAQYTISVTTNAQTITWSFSVAASAQRNPSFEDAWMR